MKINLRCIQFVSVDKIYSSDDNVSGIKKKDFVCLLYYNYPNDDDYLVGPLTRTLSS